MPGNNARLQDVTPWLFTYIQQQIFGMNVDPAVNSYFERTADNMKPKDCECGK